MAFAEGPRRCRAFEGGEDHLSRIKRLTIFFSQVIYTKSSREPATRPRSLQLHLTLTTLPRYLHN